MNQTEEEFNQSAEDYGKEKSRLYTGYESAIAKAEKVDVDALYDRKVAQYAEQSGYADAATLKDYSKRYLNQIIINEEVRIFSKILGNPVVPAETESRLNNQHI